LGKFSRCTYFVQKRDFLFIFKRNCFSIIGTKDEIIEGLVARERVGG
jgi:hypothetical protein